MSLSFELEAFLVDLATKPPTATGYYPGSAGSLDPDVLERVAVALEGDPRVANVERKYASRNLVQLWVVLS